MRFRDVQQVETFRILNENVAVPQIEKITRHGSSARAISPVRYFRGCLGAEEYVPHRGHSNRDRDQADCQDKENRRSPLSLSGLCRRLDYNPVLFRNHGETLNPVWGTKPARL